MQNLEYLFIKSRSYEEVLKKAYDLGKDLGFNYRQYLLKRCVEFDLLFKQLALESEDNYEVEKSQDKVLSFDDDDDYKDNFNQYGVGNSEYYIDIDKYRVDVPEDRILNYKKNFIEAAKTTNFNNPFSNSQSQPINQQNTSNLSENDIFSQENDLMSSSEVRDCLGISKSALKALNKFGFLKPYGEGYAGSKYYLKEDVMAL